MFYKLSHLMSKIHLLLLVSLAFAVEQFSPTANLTGKFVESARYKQQNTQYVEFNYTSPGDYYLKPTSPVYDKITVEVIEDSSNEVTLRVVNNLDSFELPHEFPFPFNKEPVSAASYSYSVNEAGSFFKLRRDNGDTVFNLKEATVLSLLYSELHASLESDRIWGFGERRTDSFKLQNGEFTFWTHDFSGFDQGEKGNSLYGHHPVMLQNINNLYHIMLVRGTRPMTLQKTDTELVFRITGGILEFKFILGKEPSEVVRAYHRYVNGWALHPFWASGWHQSRWGYQGSKMLQDVVKNYSNYGLPLEVIWTDLDYMEDRKDFTLNETLFPRGEMNQITNRSDPLGVHWVPIVDPGIAVDSDCGRDLLASRAHLNSNKQNSTPLLGYVWPGDVYYPDFNHFNASDLWHQCHIRWQQKYGILPSGIWIDMNELSNFVDGEKAKSKTKLNPKVVSLDDLPWDAMGSSTLESHTVAIDGLHAGNGKYLKGYEFIQELDFHNLNGFLESIATQESQERIHGTSLTFVLTRSQTFGSGRFVAHWYGDNGSTWAWLKSSIFMMFNYNIFGIPFSGDDVCGFNGDTNPQLCARWLALSTFYPFARSHTSIGTIDQEPYMLGEYTLQAAQRSLALRYAFLKYYYTLFVLKRDAELKAGAGTIVDPLFYRYSGDEALFEIDTQFMVGNIVVIPIVEEQKDETLQYTERSYYVPKGAVWYDFETGRKLGTGEQTLRRNFNDTVYIALNQGSVIPITEQSFNRTRYMPSEISLLVVLDQSGQARGEYLSIASYDETNVEMRCWDNRVSCMRRVTVKLSKGVLLFTNEAFVNDRSQEIMIKEVVLYYLQQVKRIAISVSSLTKQWQINL